DYDDAHQLIMVEDPVGRKNHMFYDANGNVEKTRDALNEDTTMFYDERNLLTKVIEPFDGTRSITTRYEYDEVGNLKKLISPRAHDAGQDSLTTKYVYDQIDQLKRIDLPYNTGDSSPASIYRKYDASGNVITTTVPVPTQDPALSEEQQWLAIPDDMKTQVTYFDTGLPRTIDDNVNALTTYDYNARGQQTQRKAGSELEEWSYYDDGMLALHYAPDEAHVKYVYDENNNLKTATDGTGVERRTENAVKIEVTYDSVDRVAKVRHRKERGATEPFDFTTYSYDLDGNVIERRENGVESADGTTVTTPAKRHTFTYDDAGWLQTQQDFLTTGCQKIENTFTATGLESLRKVFKASQACDASPTFTVKQSSVWDYFKNGALKRLRTVNGNVDNTTARDPIAPAVVIEKHEPGYLNTAGTVYFNGHKTSDSFFRKRSGTGHCDEAIDGCVAKYTFDGRDRLIKEDRGHGAAGAVTDYTLNAAGSILTEITNGTTTNYTYDGLQLDYVTAGALTSNYIYDDEGKLECIVNSNSTTSCPTAQQANGLLKDYTWDGLNRLWDVESFKIETNGSSTKTDDTTYTYDALDRVVEQTETHGIDTASPKDRKTTFSFLGLTSLVTKEVFEGASRLSDNKTYTYDAYDTRISMVDDPKDAAPKTYTYGYDAHGSASTLLDDSDGTVKASYGYDAYGGRDATLSSGDDENGRELDPLNPYRYTGRRTDTGSATLDMGARRFGPDSQTFLQPDYYAGALANLGLSMDPLTGNRYALAAGNPLSYVEVDGHALQKSGPGGTSITDPDDEDLTPGSSAHWRAFDEQQVADYKHEGGNRETLWDREVERWYGDNGLPVHAVPEECQTVPERQIGRTMSECFFHAIGSAPSGYSHGRTDRPSDSFAYEFAGRSWGQVQEDIKDVITGGGQVCFWACVAVAFDSDGVSVTASGVSVGRGEGLNRGFGANVFLTSGEQAPGNGGAAQACVRLCVGGYVNKSGTQGSLIGFGTFGFEVGPFIELLRFEFDE
ncbi:MAG TPA: RHS repeat-associated core domain-containing protein, partial [Actinomycetota bacterium]|nr:RHS repeat-associated core domain-containing protein [Actinomycetota bacterium]